MLNQILLKKKSNKTGLNLIPMPKCVRMTVSFYMQTIVYIFKHLNRFNAGDFYPDFSFDNNSIVLFTYKHTQIKFGLLKNHHPSKKVDAFYSNLYDLLTS